MQMIEFDMLGHMTVFAFLEALCVEYRSPKGKKCIITTLDCGENTRMKNTLKVWKDGFSSAASIIPVLSLLSACLLQMFLEN